MSVLIPRKDTASPFCIAKILPKPVQHSQTSMERAPSHPERSPRWGSSGSSEWLGVTVHSSHTSVLQKLTWLHSWNAGHWVDVIPKYSLFRNPPLVTSEEARAAQEHFGREITEVSEACSRPPVPPVFMLNIPLKDRRSFTTEKLPPNHRHLSNSWCQRTGPNCTQFLSGAGQIYCPSLPFPSVRQHWKITPQHSEAPFSPKDIRNSALTWGKSPFFGKKSVGSTVA